MSTHTYEQTQPQPTPPNMWRVAFWLLPILLPLLLALLLWQRGGMLDLDIGGITDEGITQNFHAREENASDTYRWSTRDSTLHLPAHVLPATLELRGALAPDGTQVTLHLGERARVVLPPHTGSPEMRTYRLLWPADGDVLGWTALRLAAQPPPEQERAEQRTIGMLVADVTVESLPAAASGVSGLPWGLLLVFGALPLLLLAGLRLAGGGLLTSTLASLGSGCALVLVWGWQPLWVQPFVLYALAGLLVLVGMIGWMRQVARHRPSASLPWLLVVLVASSGLIPLYLYLKYGLELWMHPDNLPILAMLAALPIPFVPRWPRWGLVAVVVIALAWYGIDNYVGAIMKDYATDFTAMFRGVRSFVNGEPLYNLENITFNSLGDTYKYPPFFVFLMAPISGLFYVEAILVWHIFNFVLLLLAAGLLWRWSGRPLLSWSSLGLLYMLLTFKPAVDAISSGQTDIIVLVSLAAALLALQHGRWFWWGAILAFPAAVKLYTGYLLMHAVALRRWWAVVGFAAAFALLNLLAVAVWGWSVHATFLFEVLPNIGGGTAWVENQTINGFVNRLFADRIGLLPDEGLAIQLITYAAAALLTGLTFWRVQHMQPEDGFGLWLVTMLVIMPISWMHYQAILLVPFYQLFVRLEQQERAARLDWRSLLLYALAWMLLCYGNQWTFFDRTMYEGPLWTLILSYKLYGMLLLWWAVAFDPTVRVLAEERQPTEQTPQPSPVMQT